MATSTRKPMPLDAESLERTRSRAPVAAPGKKHRHPTAAEPLDPHLGEVQGRKVGQKNMKAAWRGGRMH